VHIRIVSVDRELKPKFSDKVTVDIKNPDGIVIDRLSLTSSSESAPGAYIHIQPKFVLIDIMIPIKL
jgi:hypothetical protein